DDGEKFKNDLFRFVSLIIYYYITHKQIGGYMQFKRIIPFLILFLFAFTANLSFAQSSEENTFNPLGNSLGVTLEGGGVYPHTDIDPEINYLYRGGLEYFFPTSDAHAFGIKLMGGFVNLGKQDKLGDVKLGLMYALGTGGTIPYLSLGGNYIFQKDVKGVEQNSLGYFGEAGLKFFLSDALTLNLSYTLNMARQDKLEGIVSNVNDAYSTAQAGLTFFLSQDLDSDYDGVKDSDDDSSLSYLRKKKQRKCIKDAISSHCPYFTTSLIVLHYIRV
ncbi:MAG: hypothetical protein ABIJ03_00765, partial [Patescibacteria group bacterium]